MIEPSERLSKRLGKFGSSFAGGGLLMGGALTGIAGIADLMAKVSELGRAYMEAVEIADEEFVDP